MNGGIESTNNPFSSTYLFDNLQLYPSKTSVNSTFTLSNLIIIETIGCSEKKLRTKYLPYKIQSISPTGHKKARLSQFYFEIASLHHVFISFPDSPPEYPTVLAF
jgi:hypothetical protein